MKKRAASSLLAILAVVSLILPALAAASADPPAVEEPFPEVSHFTNPWSNRIPPSAWMVSQSLQWSMRSATVCATRR